MFLRDSLRRVPRRRAILPAALMTVLAVCASILGSWVPSFADTTKTISADADAAVVRGLPSWAFGQWGLMAVGANDNLQSYVRFSNIAPGYSKVVLRVHRLAGPTSRIKVQRADGRLDEATVTWDIANQFGINDRSVFAQFGSNGWYEINVTDLLAATGGGTSALFRLTADASDAVALSTKETNNGNVARLEVTYPDGPAPTTTITPPTTTVPPPTGTCTNTNGQYCWKPLKIGAGGWLTGMDMSRDGRTKIVRTDTYGAYRLDGATWTQLVTVKSMPTEFHNTNWAEGVLEIAIAPSNSNCVYMAFTDHVFRSDNRGDTWVKTAFPKSSWDPNDDGRTWGEKMAVDPSNPDVVFFGNPRDGLFVSRNAGASWAKVTGVPNGGNVDGRTPGVTGIAFAGSNTVFAASTGNGVFRSTDGGSTWSNIGGPAIVNHAVVSSDGTYFATAGGRGVWRYRNGSWTNITPSGGRWWHSITVSPTNPNRLVIGDDGGETRQSSDGGASWPSGDSSPTIVAGDIPWHSVPGVESYMSNGEIAFDPQVPDKLWFSEGIGVFTTTVNTTATEFNWVPTSAGIEQLVIRDIISAPAGAPVVGAMDRPTWYVDNPDTYKQSYGPGKEFNASWDLAFSPQDPSLVVSANSDHRMFPNGVKSAYSLDGGRNWTVFPSMPGGATDVTQFGFGQIAVTGTRNNSAIVWVPASPASDRRPYVTRDLGRTWTPVASAPGSPKSITNAAGDGWSWAWYLNRHVLVADPVTAGTFSLYHSPDGVYRSTDFGATWMLVKQGEIEAWSSFNAKMAAMPGRSGDLFFTSGPQGGESEMGGAPSGAFKRSRDGGVTWATIPNVTEVSAFGFGKEAPGTNQPTIFIAGWVSGTYGIYRSTDDAASWTKVGDFPNGSFDGVAALTGDANIWTRVYVGFNGSGVMYGQG